MKHKTISKIRDAHPYEIIKVELLADTTEEKEWIKNLADQVENYLTLNLQAVEVIEQTPPFFVIKRVKNNIGFGK